MAAMAQVAYAGAEEWMQLYQGLYRRDRGCAFSREEAGPGGLPGPDPARTVGSWCGGGGTHRTERTAGERSSSTSPMPWRSVWWMKMLSGPVLFYEGALYFRDDALR